MFTKTFHSTMKTIIRSPLTWAIVALLFGVSLYHIFFTPSFGYYDVSTGEMYLDTEKGFILTYKQYIEKFQGTFQGYPLMLFAGPLFFAILPSIVLNRDWRDGFFEIERSGNVKNSTHFFGRYFAIISFEIAVTLCDVLLISHIYYFSRGGVPDFGLWDYLLDSNIRILRMFSIVIIPGILIFSGVSILASNFLKNGILGTMVGIVYALFEYLSQSVLSFRMPDFYKNFLTPKSKNLYLYWTFFDTEWFAEKDWHNPFTTGQMFLCLGILWLIATLLVVFSYICVRKRKI